MIPKIVHVCWDDKNLLNHQSPLILNGLKNLADLNPDWEIQIHSAQEVDAYLKNVLSTDDYNLYTNTHIVERCDLWRLFKVFNEGGLYIDIDRYCNISFKDILTPNIKWVLPTSNDYDFSHDFMMSSPGNPVFENTIDLILKRKKAGYKSIYFFGPQTYMHSVTTMLTGQMIDTNPGQERFDQIRDAISKCDFILTYKENVPYDTIIYKHDPESFKKGNSVETDFLKIRQEFYRSYNIKHWTGKW